MDYTIYHVVTKQIKYNITKPIGEGPPKVVGQGCAYLEGKFTTEKYYVEEGTPILKEKSNAVIDKTTIANTTEFATISGIENPVVISTLGQRFIITEEDNDHEFEFAMDTPGVYNIECEFYTTLPISFNIEVT